MLSLHKCEPTASFLRVLRGSFIFLCRTLRPVMNCQGQEAYPLRVWWFTFECMFCSPNDNSIILIVLVKMLRYDLLQK